MNSYYLSKLVRMDNAELAFECVSVLESYASLEPGPCKSAYYSIQDTLRKFCQDTGREAVFLAALAAVKTKLAVKTAAEKEQAKSLS